MKSIASPFLLSAVLLATIMAGSANAQTDRQGGHRGPPQAALDACKGQSEGTQVEIQTPLGRSIPAVCRMVAVPLPRQGGQGQGQGNGPMSQGGQGFGPGMR